MEIEKMKQTKEKNSKLKKGSQIQRILTLMTTLFGISNNGRVIPDKTFPITLTSTNAGDRAEYNFTMALESNLIPGCHIQIHFPDQQYIDGLGLDYNFKAYSPYGKEIPSEVTLKILKVEPGYVKAGDSFTITVDGIQNPFKMGGTGLFKVYHTCGTANFNVDVCQDYAVIAVTQPKIKLLKTYVSVEPGSSDIAGEKSNYLVFIQPTADLTKNTVFRLTFPDFYNFTYLNEQVTDFPFDNPCEVLSDPDTNYKISGNITCKFSKVQDNIIEWVGNNASIPKNSNIWLRLAGVYNPSREMKTEFIKIDLVLKNTNFTYEYDDSVEGLDINPGPIKEFKVKPVLDAPLEALKNYDFEISFTPTNIFESLRIVTRFRQIDSCVITNALIPDNTEMKVSCDINSNVLDVKNIKSYQRKYKANADKISLYVNAKTSLAAGVQLPFEVYTYLNNDHTIKVDQNLTSLDSSLFISTSPPVQPSTTITAPVSDPDGANTVSADIKPLANYTSASKITLKFVFSPLFEFGVTQLEPIRCKYYQLHQVKQDTINSEGYTVSVVSDNLVDTYVSCAADSESPNVLTIPLNTGDVYYPLVQETVDSLKEENKITITNLKNPSVAGSYDVDMLVYLGDNTEPTEKSRFTVTVNAPSITITETVYSLKTGKTNLIQLKFEAPLDLDRGNRDLTNFYDQFSHIIVKFPQKKGANDAWDGRVGYSAPDLTYVPCWASGDMKTYSGGLKCRMKQGKLSGSISTSDQAVITVANYKKLKKTERLDLAFMVDNPSTNTQADIIVEVLKISSNQEFTIATKTVTIGPTAGTSGGAFTSLTITATSDIVQQKVDLTIEFSIGATAYAVGDNVALFIKIPDYWIFSQTLFDPTTVFHTYTLTGIAKNDQLFTGKFYYDEIKKTLAIIPRDQFTSGVHQIILKGIKTPNGITTTNDVEISLYANQVEAFTGTSSLGAIQTSSTATVSLTTNIDIENADGVMYQFEWTSNRNYEGNPEFVIGFEGSSYDFSAASFKCELLIDGVLQREDISIYQQTCTYLPSVTFPSSPALTGFKLALKKSIESGKKITIRIYYLTHPASSFSGNYHLSAYSVETDPYDTNDPKVEKTYRTDYFNIATPAGFLTSGTAKNAFIEYLWGIPLNVNENQTLYFDFYFDTYLPKGTKAEFFLPLRYTQLKDGVLPECYLEGNIKLLTDCTVKTELAKRSFTITLGEDYPANEKLRLQYSGFTLFQYYDTLPTAIFHNLTENTMKDFKIEAIFNTFKWAETKAADYKSLRVYNNITTQMTLPAPEIVFYPTNEAEKATYNFSLMMNQLVDFWPSDKIWIRFPDRYDLHLSKDQIYVMSNELNGALNFSVHNREITIWGFYEGKIPNRVNLSIFGVTNPNDEAGVPVSGFEMALLDKNNMTRGHVKKFGNLELSDPPDIVEIVALQNNIQYARYDDNYTFELNSYLPFKNSKQGGKIYVEYPEDFIMDIFLVKCSTNEKFSLYSTCEKRYNIYELSSANSDYNTLEDDAVIVSITGHRNAEYEGVTAPIVVYNYDTENQRVLSRSFGTLSPSYLNFTLDGLELQVNEGKPYYLEIGSFSDNIKIGAVEDLKQRLTVVPLYFDSNFLFENTPVTLVPNTVGSYINIAAPQNMLITRFYITWLKSGDSLKQFYAPIAKMPVYVIKVINKRKIVIGTTEYANVGGLSIPLEITTKNPPYDEIIANAKVDSTDIVLNQTVIPVTKGVYLIRYRIENIKDTFSGSSVKIDFTMTGTDQPSFEFDPVAASITIAIKPKDETPAGFETLAVNDNKRGRVQMYVKTDKLAYIYCVTGYRYMQDPNFKDIKAQSLGIDFSYSVPIYTTSWTKKNGTEGFTNLFWIEGLTPGTDYVSYCYTMNLNRIPSTNFKKIEFTNKEAQKIATFTMKVNQDIVSQELREEYLKRLATLLGIESSRIIEKMNCISDPPVGSESGSTYITYYVVPDPTNEDDDISPINLVRNLNRMRDSIKKFVPKLDEGNLLVMEEVKKSEPFFKSRPIMSSRAFFEFDINATVTSCGYLTISAQIVNGTRWLDSTNSTLFYYENQLIREEYSNDTQYYPYGIDNAKDEKLEFTKFGGEGYTPTVSITEETPTDASTNTTTNDTATNTTTDATSTLRNRRILKVLRYTSLTTVERFPTAFQMRKLLNQNNMPEDKIKQVPITDYNSAISVNVDGLKDNIIYNVYLSVMNDLPMYPDYMNSDYVAQLNIKTVKKRRRLVIYSMHFGRILKMITALGVLLIARFM